MQNTDKYYSWATSSGCIVKMTMLCIAHYVTFAMLCMSHCQGRNIKEEVILSQATTLLLNLVMRI